MTKINDKNIYDIYIYILVFNLLRHLFDKRSNLSQITTDSKANC